MRRLPTSSLAMREANLLGTNGGESQSMTYCEPWGVVWPRMSVRTLSLTSTFWVRRVKSSVVQPVLRPVISNSCAAPTPNLNSLPMFHSPRRRIPKDISAPLLNSSIGGIALFSTRQSFKAAALSLHEKSCFVNPLHPSPASSKVYLSVVI